MVAALQFTATTGAHHVVELTLPDVRNLCRDLLVLPGANQEQVSHWWQRLANGRDGRPRARVTTRPGTAVAARRRLPPWRRSTISRAGTRHRAPTATQSGGEGGCRWSSVVLAMRSAHPSGRSLGLRPLRFDRRQEVRRLQRSRASDLFTQRSRLETMEPNWDALARATSCPASSDGIEVL
jgi:hypothetical protein